MSAITKGHSTAQPGLRGHSWDAGADLMKRYVIELQMPGAGWVAMASESNLTAAFIEEWRYQGVTRVWDQIKNETKVPV